ncbi:MULTISPECIES: hypothetical protein [unclassified Lysinibacillus]|uniref:hypothetical protein n=1 Tax=unclassified Lysinibacillus TaxID=2636778 RepID=UPI001C276679|nr:hypothetical protein [Lysinibacillus sp. CD3-6]UED78456.1 hypothetical protein FH508_0013395 [Lysinibacillus sp. CD3-6]
MSGIYKYLKYIFLIIFTVRLISFSPDYLEPLLLSLYLLFAGLIALLGILQDFFNPSKKTDMLLRIVTIIFALVLLTASLIYKSTPSIVFSIVMLIAFSFSLFLETKQEE